MYGEREKGKIALRENLGMSSDEREDRRLERVRKSSRERVRERHTEGRRPLTKMNYRNLYMGFDEDEDRRLDRERKKFTREIPGLALVEVNVDHQRHIVSVAGAGNSSS